MKNKLSILLVLTLMIFAFVPALTLAQVTQDIDQQNPEITDETEATYSEDFDELLADLTTNEDLSGLEIETLKIKLISYNESLNIQSMSSVVDKIINEEISLGQGFVILRNLAEIESNDLFDEEKALEMINSYQDQENSGQLAFQTALELRKLSREDLSGEYTDAFASDIADIIEENGEIETSELKQLAASYRKEAREETKIERKNNRKNKLNSASNAALENRGANNASNNANNGNGNSNKSKSKNKGKSSDNSPNSNANENAKK
ncbi:MAG: hypothetical protein ACQERL_08580 [Bacillota bacterium]